MKQLIIEEDKEFYWEDTIPNKEEPVLLRKPCGEAIGVVYWIGAGVTGRDENGNVIAERHGITIRSKFGNPEEGWLVIDIVELARLYEASRVRSIEMLLELT